MQNSARLFFLFFVCFWSVSSVWGQYSRVTIRAKQPFKVMVDNQAVHEPLVTKIKLRLNRGSQYQLAFSDANGSILDETIKVAPREKRATYKIRYQKRMQKYFFALANRKVRPEPGSRNISFSSEVSQSSSGPDGVQASSSKTSGTLGTNGLNMNKSKASAKADENGVSAESSSDNTQVGSGVLGMGKTVRELFPSKKKKDTRTVVVLKLKKA